MRFSINFLQFSVHLHKHYAYFSAHSHNFSLFHLLHFLCICTNFFYTLHENVLTSAQLFGMFAQTFSSLPPHFFQLVRNFMTICFQLPYKTSQLPTAFSYATIAFLFGNVYASTAFSIRNVSITTTFLAHIVYATTMFLTHNTYLSITKYL